jgi:hypothetical protein
MVATDIDKQTVHAILSADGELTQVSGTQEMVLSETEQGLSAMLCFSNQDACPACATNLEDSQALKPIQPIRSALTADPASSCQLRATR